MNISIICVGKLKETYLKEACNEYSKRLSKYCTLNITELEDEKLSENLSSSTILNIKEKEGNKILNEIKKYNNPYIISLSPNGKDLTSEEFSKKIENIKLEGYSTILFIIGGSLGLENDILNISNTILSFSKLTFPHQLFRVFLLEQIYRGFRISSNERYHH